MSDISENVINNMLINENEYETKNIFDYDKSLLYNTKICITIHIKILEMFNRSIITKDSIEPNDCRFTIKW
jgi:hypothetical protein